MEKLARSQYLKKKDPKDCALLYLALNRVQVLAGLFKISRDEKDKLLVAFLSRNFQVLQHWWVYLSHCLHQYADPFLLVVGLTIIIHGCYIVCKRSESNVIAGCWILGWQLIFSIMGFEFGENYVCKISYCLRPTNFINTAPAFLPHAFPI